MVVSFLKEEEMGRKGDKVFYFGQTMLEILMRHPSGDVEKAIGYTSPDSGDRSKVQTCGGLENHLEICLKW